MKAIELFAGAGGLGLGISRAGFQPLDIVEWDKWCCDTIAANRKRGIEHVRNWPMPRHGDVRSFDFNGFEGQIALVSGGPPCQPFSLGGRHRANDDQRDMWSQAVRVVRETKPKAFIFENVKGLTRQAFSNYLSYVYLQLSYPEIAPKGDEQWVDHRARLEQHHTAGGQSSLTYRVVPPTVLNAADFGVPQRRERVFFVGFRSDVQVDWSFPKSTHSLEALRWDQSDDSGYWDRHSVPKVERIVSGRASASVRSRPELQPWRTVRDALAGLPDPERSATIAEFVDHKFQAGARSYPGHTGSPLDQPAKTLKAGVHGVPGGENMLCRPDGSVRYFSVRESARLQTFPDNYRFHGSWSESMRQLGNAVPVELAEVVAKSVFWHLKSFS